MRKFIGLTASVALTIIALTAWGNAPARTDLAPNMEVRIDVSALMKTVRDLPVQYFDAF
jgi:hypothetical protein